jgi:hypothetical protein
MSENFDVGRYLSDMARDRRAERWLKALCIERASRGVTEEMS